MIRALSAVVVCTLVACAGARASEEHQLGELASQIAGDEGRLDDTERQAHQLGLAWQDVTTAYDRASARYKQAQALYQEAKVAADSTGATFAQARAESEAATATWKFYEVLVRVAALVDAANLDAARSQGALRTEATCRPMSTQQYRRELERRGVDLAGKDIDHIVPRSLGGADDPSNYQILDRSLNRSLGAAWGSEKCSLAGLVPCALAVVTSRKCGAFVGPMPW